MHSSVLSVLLTVSLSPLTVLAQAPFKSYNAFVQSLPKCAQAVQPAVFAGAFGPAPVGCGPVEASTNSTDVLCICTASRTPLTAPLESFTLGAQSFEGAATAACTTSMTDINMLIAQSELWIELCMGVENGTFVGDLAGNSTAPAMPAASSASDFSWKSSLALVMGIVTLIAAGMV